VSDQIIIGFEFTADEIASQYQPTREKIALVYNGVTLPPSGGYTPDEELASEWFFLSVGSINPRKNLDDYHMHTVATVIKIRIPCLLY